MTRTPEYLNSFTQNSLDLLRERSPLVQNITNEVVTGFTANVLLALGAAPAMADLAGEAGPFAAIADGLLVNLGTPSQQQILGSREAIASATEAGTPWVLDPVAVGSLPIRTAFAQELRELSPTIVRGNASEILALAGLGSGGRGVDSTDDVDTALEAARALSTRTGGVVAVSGPIDVVTDGYDVVRLGNGTPMLTRVTGGGCALGAVMAAFAALDEDRLATTVAAITVYCIAAELADARSSGPGSFAVNFLDALAAIEPRDIAERAVIVCPN